jgi:hypothetical protein
MLAPSLALLFRLSLGGQLDPLSAPSVAPTVTRPDAPPPALGLARRLRRGRCIRIHGSGDRMCWPPTSPPFPSRRVFEARDDHSRRDGPGWCVIEHCAEADSRRYG